MTDKLDFDEKEVPVSFREIPGINDVIYKLKEACQAIDELRNINDSYERTIVGLAREMNALGGDFAGLKQEVDELKRCIQVLKNIERRQWESEVRNFGFKKELVEWTKDEF